MQMMDLVKYSPEALERISNFMWRNGNFCAVRNIAEFRDTFGYMVKVVRGRKVKHGTIGRCFWMGTRRYTKYADYWGVFTHTRIGIRDEAGNVYWTSIDNVEVIPGTREMPVKEAKKYDKVYYTVASRVHENTEESPDMRELRVQLEAASARYNELMNKEAELMDIETEQEKNGVIDEELSSRIDGIEDECAELRKEIDRLDWKHHKLWSKRTFG